MFPLYYKLSLINYLVSLTGRSSFGERVLRNCQGRLRRELNVLSLLPYLNKYRLITADFHEELTLPATHAAKVDKLVAQLPRSGADFLEHFIQCLRESVEDEPGTFHGQIADALKEELKLQITRGKLAVDSLVLSTRLIRSLIHVNDSKEVFTVVLTIFEATKEFPVP